MTFIGGDQGGIAQGPVTTAVSQLTPVLNALGSVADLLPRGFEGGAAMGPKGATGSIVPDQDGSKVKGGLSLDDPHGPKTVDSVFKPHS
jgi:hypothetical protein